MIRLTDYSLTPSAAFPWQLTWGSASRDLLRSWVGGDVNLNIPATDSITAPNDLELP